MSPFSQNETLFLYKKTRQDKQTNKASCEFVSKKLTEWEALKEVKKFVVEIVELFEEFRQPIKNGSNFGGVVEVRV